MNRGYVIIIGGLVAILAAYFWKGRGHPMGMLYFAIAVAAWVAIGLLTGLTSLV